MAKSITVKVELSTHPEFKFIGYTFINGRQLARRGSEEEILAWIDTLIVAGRPHNVSVIVDNEAF